MRAFTHLLRRKETYIQRLTCHFQARNTDSITNINTNAREAHLWITSYSESRKARKAPPLRGFPPAGSSLRSPGPAKDCLPPRPPPPTDGLRPKHGKASGRERVWQDVEIP